MNLRPLGVELWSPSRRYSVEVIIGTIDRGTGTGREGKYLQFGHCNSHTSRHLAGAIAEVLTFSPTLPDVSGARANHFVMKPGNRGHLGDVWQVTKLRDRGVERT